MVRSNAAYISRAAPERLKDELYKILSTNRAAAAFIALDDTGMLSLLFPEIEACRNLAKEYYTDYGVLTHLFESLGRMEFLIAHRERLFGKIAGEIRSYLHEQIGGGYPRWVSLKLASFLHDIGKAPSAKMREGRLRFFYHEEEGEKLTAQIAKRLRLSGDEKQLIGVTALGHMRPGNLAYQRSITDRAKYRFFRDYGDYAVALLLVSLADRFTYLHDKKIFRGNDRHHSAVMTLLAYHYTTKTPQKKERLIDGNTLMSALKLAPGKLIGKLLADVEEARALGEITTRQEALDYASSRLHTLQRSSQ